MVSLLNKDSLYNTFNVYDFTSLSITIDNMAPSMVEYYLASLKENQEAYLNRRNIQETFSVGDYHLYRDYSENIYLEFNENQDDYTESFW